MGFRHLFIAEIGDAVGEISDGAGAPLVYVLLHWPKVVPQRHKIAQSLCVGLDSLWDLREEETSNLKHLSHLGE